MAISKCPACKGTFFEMVVKEPRGSNYKTNFIQCASCGAVVIVSEYFNAGVLLSRLKQQVEEVDRRLRYIADDVERIKRSVKWTTLTTRRRVPSLQPVEYGVGHGRKSSLVI